MIIPPTAKSSSAMTIAILSPRLVPKTNLPVWRSNSLDNGRRVPLVKG